MLLSKKNLTMRLSRAVTLDNGYLTDHLVSDLKMLANLGAKFLGRAAHIWVFPEDDEQRLKKAQRFAQHVHQNVDQDIVLQCAVFEAIFPQVDKVPIPAWVFEACDEPIEQRTFSFKDMHSDLRMADVQAPVWLEDGEVPDLTLPEARRWYLYRIGRYLDAGYEAVHLGQIHLVAARDVGFNCTADLIERIRRLARQRARRGEVILDAHSHGIVRNGNLLLDFVSRPLSGKARLADSNTEDLVLQWKGGLAAGWHHGGWYATQIPNLVEVDNWGGCCWPEAAWSNRHGRAAQGRWGWDDISWFARRDKEQRRTFLQYAYRQCRLAHEYNFFQFPVCRTLGNSPLLERGPTATHYRANRQGETCPSGWSDEDDMAELWCSEDPHYWQLKATNEPDQVQVPHPVVLLGAIQEELGGNANDTLCPYSRLPALGNSQAGRTLILPRKGTWSFVIAAGGTRMEPLGQGMSPGGAEWQLTTTEDAQPVCFVYDYARRTFAAFDPRTQQSLITK